MLLISLWFACFASFGWATRGHFRNPGVMTPGMRLTLALGTLFGLLQLVALLWIRQSKPHVAAFYLASLALFWWTIQTTRGKGFGACFTSIESRELVVTGPYRCIRHPFYTSYLLAWIAGAFVYWPLVFAALAMACLYWRAAVAEEERFLAGPQGRMYAQYCRHTGRFFISYGGIRRPIRAA